MSFPFHNNCHHCRTMSAADKQRLLDAFAHPGVCLRCGEAACYGEACMDRNARRLREFAQAISPDHWTQPLAPEREQFTATHDAPLPGIHS